MKRLASGGRIDRARPLAFEFDGHALSGFAGDTLASALLANGVRIVGHSTELGRPRGVFAAGAEEPNAFVRVQADGAIEPLVRATQVELVRGLQAWSTRGKAHLTDEPDARRFDKMWAHCDVLVVGGGPAGLAETLALARSGARVMLVDDQPEPGGSLLGLPDGTGPVAPTLAELRALSDVQVLQRATAFGLYDANCMMIAQPTRLWQVRAQTVILATGAHERPLVFADNDRPGIMLAGAARTYLHRFGVAVGTRCVVFTNNDSAYGVALDLAGAGVEVAAIVDLRADANASAPGIEILHGQAVVGTDGNPVLSAVELGDGRRIACDALLVSGGFNPVVHLASQVQAARLRFDDKHQCFVPESPGEHLRIVGAAAGELEFAGDVSAQWLLEASDGRWDRHFVDLHRDTTVTEIARGLDAGLRSIEHLKRFTTAGTGADQGKTGGVLTAGVAAALLGQPVAALGTTTFRPPYVPVSFGLLAGRNRADFYDPMRTTALHAWHVARGAVFEPVGQWLRPWYYPAPGEDMPAAVVRECLAARQGVGVMDASTLGKIDVQGPDAAEFLNRLYTNTFDRLAIGSIRYGLICRADGMVFDDGVVMRLAPDRFLTSTTTGNASEVMEWMEEWLQTEWPDLQARLTSVTDHFATIALVGPRARDVLRALTADIDVDNAAFPFMTLREGHVAGASARVCRVSFSGELAFEVNVRGHDALGVWEAVMAAGEPFGITPYGTAAMHVLRAEKGYIIVGQDTDGTVTPVDLGLGGLVSMKKPDFVGRRSLARSDTARADRKQLVGLLPLDRAELLPDGAQLVLVGSSGSQGHVTSSYYSPALQRTFALALLRNGREHLGGVVQVPLLDGRTVDATVTEPVFYDPKNERRDG
ncbi:MAG TPA: 2Fe-2S iron-sulfur cluster-binding protein [Chloroflexota bacterium]